MKTNSTTVLLIRVLLFILICLYSILVFGTPGQAVQKGTTKDIPTTLTSKSPAGEQVRARPLVTISGKLNLPI